VRSKTEKFVKYAKRKLFLLFVIQRRHRDPTDVLLKIKIFIRRDEIGRRNYAVASTCEEILHSISLQKKKRKKNYIRVVTRNNPQITESKAFCRKMKNSVAF